MTAAVDTVKRALNLVGAHSEIQPASPEVLQVGFEQYVQLLEECIAEEIYFGAKLASLTSSGTVATATLQDNGFPQNREVIIAGATLGGYNGRFEITGEAYSTFAYDLAAELDTPAVLDSQHGHKAITALLIPGALADDPKEQPGATTALQFVLAVRMGPLARRAVSQDVKNGAAVLWQKLKQRYQVSSIPKIVPSRLLPRGQGSSRGQLAKVNFAGDALDEDSTT